MVFLFFFLFFFHHFIFSQSEGAACVRTAPSACYIFFLVFYFLVCVGVKIPNCWSVRSGYVVYTSCISLFFCGIHQVYLSLARNASCLCEYASITMCTIVQLNKSSSQAKTIIDIIAYLHNVNLKVGVSKIPFCHCYICVLMQKVLNSPQLFGFIDPNGWLNLASYLRGRQKLLKKNVVYIPIQVQVNQQKNNIV